MRILFLFIDGVGIRDAAADMGEIIWEREKQKGEESTESTQWVCVLS